MISLARLLLHVALLLTLPTLEAAKKKRKRSRHDAASGSSSSLSTYTPVALGIGVGSDGREATLEVRLPPATKRISINSPVQLMKHVGHAWDTVVAPHQAGLSDPRAGPVSAELSAGEAWHHYQAAKQGVVDSARFLVAFSVVPSLQLGGGGRLHAAAARGLLDEVRALLDADEQAVDAKAEDGTTPLHAAASTGHAAIVRMLLDAGADPQTTSRSGATALHVASAMGHLEATQELLASGATLVDATHKFAQCTALHFAAEMGHVGVIQALCTAGADSNARKTTGGTPLHTAADCDQPRAVRALLAPPCRADHSVLLNGDTAPLYLAAQRGFTRAAAALLDAGADMNFEMPRAIFSMAVSVPGAAEPLGAGGLYSAKNTERANGATALHAAVENGHRATVALLLERGAKQLASMEGVPPLVLALQYRHPDIALALARAKPAPDLNVRTPQDGSSALFVAAGAGYTTVVRTLLRLGAIVDLANYAGATPLSHAALRGQQSVISLLLEAGASPRLGPPEDGGALHAALRGGALRGRALAAVVDALLSHGAEARSADSRGTEALLVAASTGELATCATILRAGANASASSPAPSAVTALMRAAANGHVSVVELLLGSGADANTRAGPKMHGATALYLAAQGTHSAAVEALLRSRASVDAPVDRVHTTPLFAAAERGSALTVGVLLRYGADMRRANWNGLNAAHMAAVRGHVEVLDVLAQYESHGEKCTETRGRAQAEAASLTAEALLSECRTPPWEMRTLDGSTALILVAAGDEGLGESPSRQLAALRWLLGRGVDVEARRSDGATALVVATMAGHASAVRLLLREAGAAHSAVANDARSPLLIATRRGDVAVVRELLEVGAACDARALDAAVARREPELLALLSAAAYGAHAESDSAGRLFVNMSNA